VRTTLYPLLQDLATDRELLEPIVEFGSGRASHQAHRPAASDLFPGRNVVGVDMQGGIGVDVVQNLHSLGMGDNSIGTALLFDTIEHVREPWTAMRELHRCLKPGGLIVMTTVFLFPIHAYPDDYWRFTASAMEVLLQDFDLIVSGEAGPVDFPHTALGVAAKAPYAAEEWDRVVDLAQGWLRGPATSWKERALDLAPPWLTGRAYRRLNAFAERRHRRDPRR
jgi:SAM-dependent methyltransferase